MRIFSRAFTSIWRMRSAETLNSAARSCSVRASFSRSQRASMMRRLRGSRLVSADSRPAVFRLLGLLRLEHLQRLGVAVGGEVVDRRVGLLVLLVALERDILAGEPRFHLGDFLGLDLQLGGDAPDVALRERREAALHRAQVEEQLALRLGGGDLHQPPVAQDVLVDLGLDPVDGERHQAHAALRVEALHGLHQADVAFLDQVGVRQAVAEVAAGDRDHQAQVREHQLRAPRRGRCDRAGAGRASALLRR